MYQPVRVSIELLFLGGLGPTAYICQTYCQVQHVCEVALADDGEGRDGMLPHHCGEVKACGYAEASPLPPSLQVDACMRHVQDPPLRIPWARSGRLYQKT